MSALTRWRRARARTPRPESLVHAARWSLLAVLNIAEAADARAGPVGMDSVKRQIRSADAAVDEAVHRALGELDAGDVVAPVDQGGDAGVDLGQRADQVAEIVVLRTIARRQIEVHVAKIIPGHPLRADAAQRRFPGVHVRVDQAGHDDLVAGIDRLVGGRAEVAAHAS